MCSQTVFSEGIMVRIDAVMSRSYPEKRPENLEYADITLNREKHRVTRNRRAIHIGPKEYRILRTLMENLVTYSLESNCLTARRAEMFMPRSGLLMFT